MNYGNKRKNKLKEDFMCRNYKYSIVRFIIISGIILAGFGSPVFAKTTSPAAYDDANTGIVTEYSATASGSAVREISSSGENEYELADDDTPLANPNSSRSRKSPAASLIPDGWYYSLGAIVIFVASIAKKKLGSEQ